MSVHVGGPHSGETSEAGRADTSWRDLPAPWPAAFAWVETTLGAEVVGVRRQARWRPAWFVDVAGADGTRRTVYLRCQREESLPWTQQLSLEREYRIMTALEQEGIKVPRLLGYCPEPAGILMECVAGRDRFDDRDSPDARDHVIEAYMTELGRAHDADVASFENVGLRRPRGEREIGLMGFELSERWYRSVKTMPDPVNEFLVGWVNRHVPLGRDTVSWIHFDAGQFLHHDGVVTALMDVEFSALGDPLADLGAMRMRDTAQPIGDLTHAFAHYAATTGRPVLREVVNFHTVRFALLTAFLSVGARLDPEPEFDLAQWESWALMSQVICLEVIAEELGITLGADEPLPESAPTRRRPWLLSPDRVLSDVLDGLDEESHLAYRLRIARDMARAALRADELADALEQRDRLDEQALLGIRPRNWVEGDRMVEDMISVAGPDRDAELVRFLYRRVRRQQAMMDPSMRDVRGFKVQAVDWARVEAAGSGS